MIRVTFIRPYNGLNPGETAGYAPHIAKALCSGSEPVARYFEEPAAPVAAESDAPDFDAMKKPELVAYAEANGLDATGTAKELRARFKG